MKVEGLLGAEPAADCPKGFALEGPPKEKDGAAFVAEVGVAPKEKPPAEDGRLSSLPKLKDVVIWGA